MPAVSLAGRLRESALFACLSPLRNPAKDDQETPALPTVVTMRAVENPARFIECVGLPCP
jgi:hypothetical protein